MTQKWGRLLIAAALVCSTFLLPTNSNAQIVPPPAPAEKPPMGWNSWDSYGLQINEQQFRDNTTVLAKRLSPFGYRFVVIDEGWYMENPEQRSHPDRLQYATDANGRFLPEPNRYPSAMRNGKNEGFTALADWVHAQGLLFGIHVIRGIPKISVERNAPIEGSSFTVRDAADESSPCGWDPTSWGVKGNAAGQAWYDSLVRQFAGWGVDFLKVDCIATRPYRLTEIRQIHTAIERSGRPIVLSLSPGGTALEHARELAPLAQMWRISNDVWDLWDTDKGFPKSVKSQFPVAAKWASTPRTRNWPDADMLAFGELRPTPPDGPGARKSRLTLREEKTQLTLWAFARSPLFVGTNLTLLDDETFNLITNPSILAVDQDSHNSRQALVRGSLIAWTAGLRKGCTAVGLFNIGDTPEVFATSLADIGLGGKSFCAKDAWTGKEEQLTALNHPLAPHESRLLLFRPQPDPSASQVQTDETCVQESTPTRSGKSRRKQKNN